MLIVLLPCENIDCLRTTILSYSFLLSQPSEQCLIHIHWFTNQWRVSMLMMIFQGRQCCPHFTVEESETPRTKSFVQDTMVRKRKGVVDFHLVRVVSLESICWFYINMIILLLFGSVCGWVVLWRIWAGIKCQSIHLEPLDITGKFYHTTTLPFSTVCVQTSFWSSLYLQV